ncbi:MAG TPA: hypothetical protein VGE36_14185 [Roseateles sp.]
MNIRPAWLIAGAAVGGALLWAAYRIASKGQGAQGVGETLGGAAVDLANGVITGTVTGIGEVIGIPKTNMTECERAKAEGRTWDASFACPAGDFLRYVWN